MRVRSLGLGHAAVRWVCATHKRPLLQLTDMRFRFASKQFVDCHIYQQPATCTCWPDWRRVPTVAAAAAAAGRAGRGEYTREYVAGLHRCLVGFAPRPLLQLTDMRFRFASKQFVDCHIYQQPATCTCWPDWRREPC